MCGDIDENARLEDELLARRLALAARRYGIAVGEQPQQEVRDIAAAGDRHAYMDEAFRQGLMSALARVETVPEGQRVEAIASQAIVLARLAGWLAGHLPPGADMLRFMMEAMLDGHGEPGRAWEESADHHHHHHKHGHGHRH